MELTDFREKVTEFAKKYRYVLLVLLAGIGLMLLPSGDRKAETAQISQEVTPPALEQELSRILSKIKGVGDVEVLLTQSAGEKIVYQTDTDISENTRREETVLISDSDRKEYGLVQQTLPPRYQGAVVVCEGAGDPGVRLAVVEAVADATGLGADRICVLKMK